MGLIQALRRSCFIPVQQVFKCSFLNVKIRGVFRYFRPPIKHPNFREGLHLGLHLGLHEKNEMFVMGLHLGLQNCARLYCINPIIYLKHVKKIAKNGGISTPKYLILVSVNT